MTTLLLKRTPVLSGIPTKISSSKSLSNRALIVDALSGFQSTLHHLSDARDTALMKKMLHSHDTVLDILDAGTTMRFLTAYFAVTNQHKILTGSARMKERPIAPLVEALRAVGATINYTEKEGFPPIEILGMRAQQTDTLEVPASISSQFISALMMVAPLLPKGLRITWKDKISSLPYIHLTASVMKNFGVSPILDVAKREIIIPSKAYTPGEITIETDWSSASYWFAFVAMADEADIFIPHLSLQSEQGDKAIASILTRAGVAMTEDASGIRLRKTTHQKEIVADFTHCPDIAQTVIPVCAAKNIRGVFTGLESLRIKETDRLLALQHETAKIGATLAPISSTEWQLTPGNLSSPVTIHTYHDHRMAMGFAPWATQADVVIEQPDVVNKSYPNFWEDMKSVGFTLTEI